MIKAVNRGGSDNNLYKDYRKSYIDIVYRVYVILLVFDWCYLDRLFFLVSQVLISSDVF